MAASSARFGEVEINHGWGPPLPITPFALGLKRAKEVLLLGEMMDAEVARMADRIAVLKPEAVAANKRLVNGRYERAGFVPGTG